MPIKVLVQHKSRLVITPYFLVGGFVCCLLLLISGGVATGQEATLSNSPGDCLICHRAVYRLWGDSAHNRTAFRDVAFQAVWERARQSSDCLACHSTGTNLETGTVGFEGVGCTACHLPVGNGDYDEEVQEHERLSIPDESEDCAGCHGNDHAVSYREWEASPHNGGRKAECVDCHDVHSGGLLMNDPVELCGSCHFQPVPTNDTYHMGETRICTDCHPEPVVMDNVHMHNNAEPVADCVDCHMVTEMGPWGRYLINTGHTMNVSLTACVNCHGALHTMQPRESD